MASKKELNKIDGRLDSIEKVLVKQEENLRLHMYRTDLAEKRLEHIEGDMEPIKEHVSFIKSSGKFIAWLLGSGVLITLFELYLRK